MTNNKHSKTGSSGLLWKIVIFAAIVALTTLLWLTNKTTSKSQPPSAPVSQSLSPPQELPQMSTLAGKWLRPDGGYVIEISKIKEDGTFQAGYFNPRSIHVAQANASVKQGKWVVFIKLQDQGYPGSTYTLTYDAQNDALIGTYFQAAYNQNYNVIFTRMKE